MPNLRLLMLPMLLAATVSCGVLSSPPPADKVSSRRVSIAPGRAVLFPVVYSLDLKADGKPVSIPAINDSLSGRMTRKLAANAGPGRSWTTARADTLQAQLHALYSAVAAVRNRWIAETRTGKTSLRPLREKTIAIPPALVEAYGNKPWTLIFIRDQIWLPRSTMQQFGTDVNEAVLDHAGRAVLGALVLIWGSETNASTRVQRQDLLDFVEASWNSRKTVSGEVLWDIAQSASLVVIDPVPGTIRSMNLVYFPAPGYSMRLESAGVLRDALFR